MAKLTAAGRNKISSSNFALPGRRYPIEDPNHARNALARASQHATPSERITIERKVHEKFPSIGQAGARHGHKYPKYGAGHYLSTPTPVGPEEGGGGSSMGGGASAGGGGGSSGGGGGGQAGAREDNSRKIIASMLQRHMKGTPMAKSHGYAGTGGARPWGHQSGARPGGMSSMPPATMPSPNPGPPQGGRMMQDSMHPRQHALAMASATHLLNMGHIDKSTHDTIHSNASRQLQSRKSLNKGQGAGPLAQFGALAPMAPQPTAPNMGSDRKMGQGMPTAPQMSPGKRQGRVTGPPEW